MKKIFLFCLLLIPQMKLKAEETWSKWSQDKPIGENIIIETEERYKWYKNEEKVDYIRSDDEHNCEYLDKDNYILSNWVFSYDLPEYKEYRMIENVELRHNKDINLIKTLNIFNMISSGIINITEIKLTSNETRLEYGLIDHTNSYTKKIDKLNDDITDEIAIDLRNNDKLLITLYDFKEIENMKLEIYYINDNIKVDQFSILSKHDPHNYMLFQNITNKNYIVNCSEKVCKLSIDLEETIKNNAIEIPISFYKYQDKLYKCINIEQNYLEGYHSYIEGYEKDETSKLMFYRYKINKNDHLLNKIDEIIYNQKETDDKNNEYINDKKSNSLISYASEKNTKTNQKSLVNKVLIFTIIFLLVTTISLIIKKIVNKYRTK